MITVNLNIICEDAKNPNGYIYSMLSKTYNTNLIPMSGMELEDMAWKNPRIIDNVVLSPEANCYILWCGGDRGQGKEYCAQIQRMYESHGWKKY